MTKVVGVGWAKTGTTTLGECLRIIGYRHATTRLDLLSNLILGDLETVMGVARHFDSFDDWPWTVLFREFDQRYEHCKFILTTRNDDAWLRSYKNMLTQQNKSLSLAKQRQYLYGFDVDTATDQQLIDRRRRHEDEVREYFADRQNALLEVNWESGDGWNEICNFLNRVAPKSEFPH